ncbi:MAG: hypothetical protein AAFW73_12405 [Bacteroidota bacterium]
MIRYYLTFYTCLTICCSLAAQTNVRISDIQGDGLASPFRGQLVRSDSNVVTATFNRGFFLQSIPSREDGDPGTSEGLLVFTSSAPSLSVGDLINITGTVDEFETETEIVGFQTTWEVLSSDYPLPDPILLDRDFPATEYRSLPDLERIEGMRVRFTDGTICAPGDEDDAAGFYLSDNRPFREAGISAPGVPGLPIWDNNPELLFIDLDFLPVNDVRFASGMQVTATGVLSVQRDHYRVMATDYDLSGELVDQRARPKAEDEVSIGCLNALFLDSDSSPENIIHRQQIAIYVVDGMQAPDIVAFQEVENIAAMRDVANRISQLDPSLQYEAYLLQGNSSSINLGYLVNPQTVREASIVQRGKNETLSIGGVTHNRPPLLLNAQFATAEPTPIQILNLHLKSLIGIEGSNSFAVRTKRHEAAISVAQMVRELQNDNLVVLGDFNAFEFSDGYVDVVNQISGQPSLGAEFPVQSIVNPPLTNLSTSDFLEPAEQYSYVFRGNAQILDHCLANDFSGLEVRDLQYIRGNADNPDLTVNNPLTPQFSSDHDGFVLYLELADTLLTGQSEPPLDPATLYLPNPYPAGGSIEFSPSQTGDYNLRLWTSQGRLRHNQALGQQQAGAVRSYFLPNDLPRGHYILEIAGKGLSYRRQILILE